MNYKQQQFVEEFGLFFEQAGLPRMAGRILGWLMLSNPPHQSIDELSEGLLASKGSISTMSRLLIQMGLLERIGLPGVRHDYFRIRPGALEHMLRQNAEQITILRQLAERGLELVEAEASETRHGLEEMRDMYTFFEREFGALVERWEQERDKHRAQFVQKGGGQ
ncbi:MAG: MarR family transcriptional regulator [Dehalococcoidia bacterium]|nr:MarR family transcriptional regulator [Dehalococcoidia bacterium]